MEDVRDLLARLSISPTKDVTPDPFDELGALYECQLPTDLLALYSVTGPTRVREPFVEILSIEEAWKWMELWDHPDEPFMREFGLFPFMESGDSNPMCVACREPLRARIICVVHDDAPRLMYHDLRAMLKALSAAAEQGGDWDPASPHAPRDYGHGTSRTSDDVAMASRYSVAGSQT